MSQRVALYGCRVGYKEQRERNKMHLGVTAMRENARLSAVSQVRTILVEIENTFDSHGKFLHTWWCFFHLRRQPRDHSFICELKQY